MGTLARAFGGSAREPRRQEAALSAALLAALDRDYERAEQLLRLALRQDPQAVDPYRALARLHRTRGDFGRAIRLNQALLLRRDLGPTERTEALADLGGDFRRGGFLRRAIAAYEEVLSRAPRHRGALGGLASLLAQVRSYPGALRCRARLARLERRDGSREIADLYVEMAETAHAEGRSDEARRALRKALRRRRDTPRAWILLGELEAERGRMQRALAAWMRVPELDRRGGPRVYARIEAGYASLGRTGDYEAYLRALLETRPEDRGARLALARSLAARGETGAAEQELRLLLQADGDDLEARSALLRMRLLEERDPREAARELLDTLERRGLLRVQEALP